MKTTLDIIKKEILGNPGISRRDIAETTGLDIRTVSAAVNKLLKQGFITVRRDERKSVGRTGAVYFPVDENKLCFAGIYLDLQQMTYVFKDIYGNILESRREAFYLEWASLNHTARRIQRVISDFTKRKGLKINAVALTIRENRGLQFSEGLRQLLSVYTALPIYCGTPIDAFAWSARMQNPGAKRIVMVHFGQIRIEISLIEGLRQNDEAARFAKELSHTSVEKDGPPCYCGKSGCLEYYVHGFSMNEELREIKNIAPDEEIDMGKYYDSGDTAAVKIVEKAEKHMLWALKETEKEYKPDLFLLLTFKSDKIVKNMKGITSGAWIQSKMTFHIYTPDTTCSEAIADKAILLNTIATKEQI